MVVVRTSSAIEANLQEKRSSGRTRLAYLQRLAAQQTKSRLSRWLPSFTEGRSTPGPSTTDTKMDHSTLESPELFAMDTIMESLQDASATDDAGNNNGFCAVMAPDYLSVWSPEDRLWACVDSTADDAPPIKKLVIVPHDPKECLWSQGVSKYAVSSVHSSMIPLHIPIVQINLHHSPLYLESEKLDENGEAFPLGQEEFEIEFCLGYAGSNPHGRVVNAPSSPGGYVEDLDRVVPHDETHNFRSCDYIDAVARQSESIGKLVLRAVPFHYGYVDANVYRPLHDKADELVLVLTNPPFSAEAIDNPDPEWDCGRLSECRGALARPSRAKCENLLRLIPAPGRLKKVTLVFWPDRPGEHWDRTGCKHKQAGWWCERAIAQLGFLLGRSEFDHIDFELVNLEALSPARPRRCLWYLARCQDRRSHGGLDSTLLLTLGMGVRWNHRGALCHGLVNERKSRMLFSSLEEWTASGASADVFTAAELERWLNSPEDDIQRRIRGLKPPRDSIVSCYI